MSRVHSLHRWSSAPQVLGALAFLIAIALVPAAIVIFVPSQGGIWVAGYLAGMMTAPLVAIGALRALSALEEVIDLNVPVALVVYAVLVTLISVISALWSFLA